MLNIVWFKRDLRTTDHAPLIRAAETGPVVPLYIAEPSQWSLPTASTRQWRFTARALAALRTQLAILGAPLVFRYGEAIDVLTKLCAGNHDVMLWSHDDTPDAHARTRDAQIAEWASRERITWHRLPEPDPYDTATPPLPPELLAHGIVPGRIVSERILYLEEDPCADMPAGPTPARHLLETYLAPDRQYPISSRHRPDAPEDAAAKLSPHFALGTLSLREAANAARKALDDHPPGTPRAAARSLLNRLDWRLRLHRAFRDTPEIETEPLHAAFRRDPRNGNARHLKAWINGHTGQPLVDAAMRALNQTGWMNFRLRALVAGYAAHQLGMDWRQFGPALARQFIDFEPAIHWSHCQLAAGTVGLGHPQVPDPLHLSELIDPSGTFIRKWVPELAEMPSPMIHAPTDLPAGYPQPIESPRATAEASARLEAIHASPGFAAESARLAERHALA